MLLKPFINNYCLLSELNLSMATSEDYHPQANVALEQMGGLDMWSLWTSGRYGQVVTI